MTARFDVVVVGGGNAALCAALAARERGATVLLLERADHFWRGGNSKYTRNIRVVHERPDAVMSGTYSPSELLADLTRVTGSGFDPVLANRLAEASEGAPEWMEQHGARWQPAMRGTLQLATTNRFFLGGGKALVNTYYRRAEELGVEVWYGATATDLFLRDGVCTAVMVEVRAERTTVDCGAVVVASGGFEANLDWLREYWGDAVDRVFVRGTRFNDGLMLRRLLDHGAEARGNPRGFHAIAVDARSPRYEGGIVTRVDSVPFSVMVNRAGQRVSDEGSDIWPRRYASWGTLLIGQPGQRGYSIFDSKVNRLFLSGPFPPQHTASTIGELARSAGIEPSALETTIAAYNDAVVDGTFDPAILDDCRTEGLEIPKSHWAQRIDVPPYYCYELAPGITFTFLGVAVDETTRVRRQGAAPFENVFAAGEVMAGNILQHGYMAGIGMTIGTVFGRLAGAGAAAYVHH